MNNKILIVDDDPNIREVISVLLSSEGYKVLTAENGQMALDIVNTEKMLDVVVLDIMMPDMDGIEVCRRDRDKVIAYTTGGDDFLVKPFSQTELLMKIKSLIRRHNEYDKQSASSRYNEHEALAEDVYVDIRTRSVRKNGKRINLTDKEFDILRFFMEHKGEVVRNKDLYENVWGEEYLSSAGNTIMVHVLNLRKKLEDDVSKPKIIKTVWGKGYRIE